MERGKDDQLDEKFISAKSFLRIAIEALMQKHGVDRATAIHWLRIAGEVVFKHN
jgi:hypothetical protein